ncbi:MAG: hypothetical protein WCG25_09420 [bacterium]
MGNCKFIQLDVSPKNRKISGQKTNTIIIKNNDFLKFLIQSKASLLFLLPIFNHFMKFIIFPGICGMLLNEVSSDFMTSSI